MSVAGISEIKKRLSVRMHTVCDMVSPGKRVADIGCDHAFVSIYLVKSKKAAKVYALDVKRGPLDIAKRNIEAYNVSDCIDVRLSDGFAALSEGETDAAILAGMGGALIIRLMDAAGAIIHPGYELVLQPQSETGSVRRYLREHGFVTEKEAMVCEEDKYYTIIKAIKGSERKECTDSLPDSLSEIDLKYVKNTGNINKIKDEYGAYLINVRDGVFIQYLQHEQDKRRSIIKRLEIQGGKRPLERIAEIKEDMALTDEILSLMEAGVRRQNTFGRHNYILGGQDNEMP